MYKILLLVQMALIAFSKLLKCILCNVLTLASVFVVLFIFLLKITLKVIVQSKVQNFLYFYKMYQLQITTVTYIDKVSISETFTLSFFVPKCYAQVFSVIATLLCNFCWKNIDTIAACKMLVKLTKSQIFLFFISSLNFTISFFLHTLLKISFYSLINSSIQDWIKT